MSIPEQTGHFDMTSLGLCKISQTSPRRARDAANEPGGKAHKEVKPLTPARQPTVQNMRLWKAIAFAGGLVLGLYSDLLDAAPSSGGDTVQGRYDVLLSTMKNGRALGESGRLTQLEPVIRRSFDIAAMARLSVGPTWARLAEAQRQQLIDSFRTLYVSDLCRPL
jgi:hypothetical protein